MPGRCLLLHRRGTITASTVSVLLWTGCALEATTAKCPNSNEVALRYVQVTVLRRRHGSSHFISPNGSFVSKTRISTTNFRSSFRRNHVMREPLHRPTRPSRRTCIPLSADPSPPLPIFRSSVSVPFCFHFSSFVRSKLLITLERVSTSTVNCSVTSVCHQYVLDGCAGFGSG